VENLFRILAFATALFQVATVVFLFLGRIRKYAFVLGYCLLELGTSVVEMTVTGTLGGHSRQFRIIFWTDELVLDVVLFCILILLTDRAMEGSPARGAMRRMLGAVMVVALALPFVLYRGAFVKAAWFDHTAQLLNFGAAILNLGLWTALLGSRKRDPQLMMVSAGFGIIATGAAISFGLRRLVHIHGAAWTAANFVFVAAYLLGSLILCRAFLPVGIFRKKADPDKRKPYPLNKGFA
jgi:hypothetical protein